MRLARDFSTNHARGLVAEIYALLFLTLKGYRLQAWRYKTPVGEVDLIMRRRDTLIFVEVKLRPSLDGGLESITQAMQGRISRAAGHYLSRQGDWPGQSRFDVIAVAGWRLRHLDNAWLPPT